MLRLWIVVAMCVSLDAEAAEPTTNLPRAGDEVAESNGRATPEPTRGELESRTRDGLSPSLAELDRAYGEARSEYRNGRYDRAVRALRAVLDDLDRLQESGEVYESRIRALLLLAHAEGTLGRVSRARAVMERIVAVEPQLQPDPEQYSPSYRREFEAARVRVAARPRHRLTVTSVTAPTTVYIEGRPSGTTPITLQLPTGRYRISGATGAKRVRGVWLDLQEDRQLALESPLAETAQVHVEASPERRAAASASQPLAVGASADAAALPPALRPAPPDGASQADAPPVERSALRPRPWLRPVAVYATGGAAVLLAGLAAYQGISAHGSYQDARALLRPDGTLAPGSDQSRYNAMMERGDTAAKRAYWAAGGALLMATAAGLLWYVTGEPPSATPAARF